MNRAGDQCSMRGGGARCPESTPPHANPPQPTPAPVLPGKNGEGYLPRKIGEGGWEQISAGKTGEGNFVFQHEGLNVHYSTGVGAPLGRGWVQKIKIL